MLAVEPWRADAWEHLGRAEYELSHYDQAAYAFEQARKYNELSYPDVMLLGKSYLQLKRGDDARQLWREISASAPGDFDFLMKIAADQREIGDFHGTVSTLLNAYALKPEDPQVKYLLGIHLAVIQPQSAVRYLERGKSLGGTDAELADSLLNEISQPGEAQLYRTLRIGQILYNAKIWDLAAQAFAVVAQSSESSAYAWALWGEALQHVNGSGLEQLQKALQLDPQSDTANALMALYFRRQNKPEMALPYLYKAVAVSPKEPSWQIELGDTLAETGDLKSALAYLQKATVTAPDDPLAWQSLAQFCFTRNVDISTGLEAARKALALDPADPQLMDLMGMGLMINGDLDSAERFIRQAVQTAPEEAAFHLHLGQVFLQQKDCSQAAVELRRAIELSQDERITSNADRLLSDYCSGY